MTGNSYAALYFPLKLAMSLLFGLFLWRMLFIWFTGGGQIMEPWTHGLRLDLSMVCGAVLLIYVPWILYLSTGKRFLISVIRFLTVAVWIFICLIEYSSALLYREWGTTTDYRSFSYLSYQGEAWASVYKFIPLGYSLASIFVLFFILRVLAGLFVKWSPVRDYKGQSWLYVALLGPLAFLALRGGWQKIPIHPSDAFYSTDMSANFAATNKVWYFLYSVAKKGRIETANKPGEIGAYANKYKEENASAGAINLPDWRGKNIVIIIAEGWSADMVSYLGGKENITPFFDSLSRESCRFTNAFSSGFRTDQGVLSILFGIPSVRGFNLAEKIGFNNPFFSVSRLASDLGMTTSFVYGGDLNFASMGNIMRIAGFSRVTGESDFPSEARQSSWGVPDHFILARSAEIQSMSRQPFFSVTLLISSHAPFDVPDTTELKDADLALQYKRSVSYSDRSIKAYFDKVKKQPWFDNTVFILTSDHGSTHSRWAGLHDQNRFRIPLIVYTPDTSLCLSDQEITTPCNHFDLPFTIAGRLGADQTHFVFGRDMFIDQPGRKAYWSTDANEGYYSISEAKQSGIGTPGTENSLFVDMVSTWFHDMQTPKGH